MGRRKSLNEERAREKNWGQIFSALVKLSQNLQKDRQFLEDKIKSLNEVIYKMKMEQRVDSSKAELMLGLKDREVFIYKHRYENEDDELADFREWFDYLSQKCLNPNITSNDVNNKGEGSQNKALQNDVRKLKGEIEKCKEEKNTEISALLEEKNFIWDQYKKMESGFTMQLRKKSDEVEQANEKVQLLVDRAESLQTSNEKLRTDFTKMEAESVQKSEEISKLLKEIEILKSRSGSASGSLHSCRTGPAASYMREKNSTSIKGKIITVKKEPDPPPNTAEKMAQTKRAAHKSTGGKAPRKQFITKGSSSSKRKSRDAINTIDTPGLFSSSFKVPKLRKQSSLQKS